MEKNNHPGAIAEAIKEADMVLVGLGEEFDDTRVFRDDAGYREGKDILAGSERSDLIPAWQSFFRDNREHQEALEQEVKALNNLALTLKEKNYFIVSVSTNPVLRKIPWRDGRLVMPCGSDLYVQCGSECARGIAMLTEEERTALYAQLEEWRKHILSGSTGELPQGPGICSECGKGRKLNNIYNSEYDERGYLADWQNYTKWLQGTLNRKLVVLELGVGMNYPSVIRWPFEKVAFFNKKAYFYRINENLYQLTEELSEKGASFAKNAIDWLQNLC